VLVSLCFAREVRDSNGGAGIQDERSEGLSASRVQRSYERQRIRKSGTNPIQMTGFEDLAWRFTT